MGRIVFESVPATLEIRNPLRGFALEEQRVEVRRDPLLGDTSVYNPLLGNKTGYFGVNDPALIARLVEDSAGSCIFCGERLAARAASYPDDLVPGGRIEVGEATLFPNLFALGAYHPVVVLSRKHFLGPSEFTPELLADGITAARDFLRSVQDRDASAAFTTLNANYLFPAGASQVHPHLQMLVTPVPYSYHARVVAACRRHLREHGSCYHDDLVREEERLGGRYVARLGGWHWVAAYAPLGNNEITAIHGSELDFGALPDADVRDLAAGISKVLGFYGGLGHLSFNWTLYSARGGGEGSRLLFRIVSRQNLSAAYRNDDYFLQKMLQSELIVTLPEELAGRLRRSF